MPRIPAGNDPVEPIGTPVAPEGEAVDPIARAAQDMGFDLNTMTDEDRQFISVFVGGGLESLQPEVDPENPLIPGEPSEEDATPPTDASGLGSGLAPDASETDEGAGGAPVPPAPESALPSTVPVLLEPQTADDAMVTLPSGIVVPAAQLEQIIQQAQANQLSDEEIQFINARRQGITPPGVSAPNTQPEEWIDTQAQQAYTGLEGTLQQVLANQQQMAADTLARERIQLAEAIEGGAGSFRQARGLDEAQTEKLMKQVNMLGSLRGYHAMYPNDPRSAVAAALDAMYWATPEYRELEQQRAIAQHMEETRSTEGRKAANAALNGSQGGVDRTPPAPTTREGSLSAMASFIEAAQREG